MPMMAKRASIESFLLVRTTLRCGNRHGHVSWVPPRREQKAPNFPCCIWHLELPTRTSHGTGGLKATQVPLPQVATAAGILLEAGTHTVLMMNFEVWALAANSTVGNGLEPVSR